jgi:hypothetical protein
MALTLEPRAKRNNKHICRAQAICGSGQNGHETTGEHRGQANDVHGANGGTDNGASDLEIKASRWWSCHKGITTLASYLRGASQ